MGEPNIVLARIDNRLIHGQVATQWTGSVGANLIPVSYTHLTLPTTERV